MELTLTPKELPSISGNFEQYKNDLTTQIEKYKAMPLTEETVAPVKSAIRQIRTTLEKMESTAIGAYFDTPKKMLKAQFAELYNIVADGENKVDAIIAEETRKRNDATTTRLVNYIKSKITGMSLEEDAVDYVILEKQFYNKTAKDAEVYDNIDRQLASLEKNLVAFKRAEKKINSLSLKIGPVFNKGKFLYGLSKYGDNNDSVAAQADEEAERISNIPAEEMKPATSVGTSTPMKRAVANPEQEIIVSFPLVDKKDSKGTEDLYYTFTVPKEAKKQFAELLTKLKEVGIKSKKM
jgi:hypothetical protein